MNKEKYYNGGVVPHLALKPYPNPSSSFKLVLEPQSSSG
jgi:hypothetical protein